MDINKYKVKYLSGFDLSDIKTNETGKFSSKEKAIEKLTENIELMNEFQGKLYAQDNMLF